MDILRSAGRFPDEGSCIFCFKTRRGQEGVVCKKCMGKEHDWLAGKNMFQCKSRESCTGPKSGAVMENSKLTLRKWLAAITFIGAAKQGFYSFSRYQTGFGLYYKIPVIGAKRDNGYKLEDRIEDDVE